MLATKRSPWRRAASMRLMCPACRLPMFGTKPTRRPCRRQARTCSRTAPIVVTGSMGVAVGSGALDARRVLKAMLRGRVFGLAHGAHVTLQRIEIARGPVHEVAYEARLATGGDVQDVVRDQDLAIGVGTCADADHRHLQLRRDGLAERGGNA